MLKQVAAGVQVHESEFCQSNTIVVQGSGGVLLVDPGVHGHELDCLVSDLARTGQKVLAGFSTHPHWDHLLWHPGFGDVPRFGTSRCAATVQARLAGGIDAKRFGIPEDVPLELLGRISGLPDGTTRIPWDGPPVQILGHEGHAPGHAALWIQDQGVLIGGDTLSDVLIPMLDLAGATDPIEDYLAALLMLEGLADDVEVLIPGHGAIGGLGEAKTRILQDRKYLQALRAAHDAHDSRVGASAKPGWEWVADVHARQIQALESSVQSERPKLP